MSFLEVLRGSELLTLEVLYRMPDHPALVQEFVWQVYDIAPQYPRVKRFLDYWDNYVEAPRIQTRIAVRGLVSPVDWTHVSHIYGLN